MKTRISFVLLVVACGGGGGSTDIEATLRFADLTDTEISRLVAAASGSEGFQAQATLSSFDNSFETDPDPCPAIAISGNTVTITGGCTTRDMVAIEGSGAITNPLGWGSGANEIEYDYGSDSIYELNGFALVQAGQRRAFDGIFVVGSGYGKLDMNLTTDSFGVAVRSDIYMDCGNRTSCSISGSGVELVSVGGAKVSGTVIVSGQMAAATYTLKGIDTVKVTMANNCVSWTLEGTDRKFDPCTR
jgi:hypothetical protein